MVSNEWWASETDHRSGTHAIVSDVTIIQASQGLCSYVMQHVREAAGRGIVIGYDHRHNSEKWAKLTAAAFLSQKIKVYLLDGLVHTPLYVFSSL